MTRGVVHFVSEKEDCQTLEEFAVDPPTSPVPAGTMSATAILVLPGGQREPLLCGSSVSNDLLRQKEGTCMVDGESRVVQVHLLLTPWGRVSS